MQMTYPLPFRQKVFSTKAKFHLTFEQISQRFDIAKDVELTPDAYQWERAKRLGVAERTISYGLKRLTVSYKKRSNIQRQMSKYV